jgi:hypothetical protein
LTWPLTVLVLGFAVLGFAVHALRVWRSTRASDETVSGVKSECAELRAARDALALRMSKIEAALRIDGDRVMREAMKNQVPGFMR